MGYEKKQLLLTHTHTRCLILFKKLKKIVVEELMKLLRLYYSL